MDWPTAGRCALLAGIAAAALIAHWVAVLIMAAEMGELMDRRVLHLHSALVLSVVGIYAVIGVLGWRRPRSRRLGSTLEYAVTFMWPVVTLSMMWTTGLYTSGYPVLLLSGLVLGLALIRFRVVATGFAFAFVYFFALVWLERTERIAYAPLFRELPMGEDGRPLSAWMRDQVQLITSTTMLVWFVLGALLSRWRERERQVIELSRIDGLTGVYNRRYFIEIVEIEHARAYRYDSQFAIIMVDLDHFKAINDRHGHLVGDAALVAVAGALRAALRTSDLIGRYGGEEFSLFLPEASTEEAFAAACRCADRIKAIELKTGKGENVRLTASFGVAAFAGEESLAEVLRRADNALYEAKASGRDRVIVAIDHVE